MSKRMAVFEEVHNSDEENDFVTGFRLGEKMIIEAFCEYDGFFTDFEA